jgi:hypothetical protein
MSGSSVGLTSDLSLKYLIKFQIKDMILSNISFIIYVRNAAVYGGSTSRTKRQRSLEISVENNLNIS